MKKFWIILGVIVAVLIIIYIAAPKNSIGYFLGLPGYAKATGTTGVVTYTYTKPA